MHMHMDMDMHMDAGGEKLGWVGLGGVVCKEGRERGKGEREGRE